MSTVVCDGRKKMPSRDLELLAPSCQLLCCSAEILTKLGQIRYISIHSDLLYTFRQNFDNKSDIYIFETLVISGLQICFEKNQFSALPFQPLQLLNRWDSNLLSLDNVYYVSKESKFESLVSRSCKG